MSYIDQGFNQFLERGEEKSSEKLSPLTIDRIIPEIQGEKVVNYKGDFFDFSPSSSQTEPKEGNVYYDKDTKKLRIFTGSSYETVTST